VSDTKVVSGSVVTQWLPCEQLFASSMSYAHDERPQILRTSYQVLHTANIDMPMTLLLPKQNQL
jgi:hypothetical protein